MSVFDLLDREPMVFLRRSLRANAAFSTLSGMLMIAGGSALGAWLGRPGSVATDGIALLAFAGIIVWITRAPTVNLRAAWLIVVLDALYVLDTGRQLLAGHFSAAGNWFYGIAVLIVLDLAVMQALGAIRCGRARGRKPVAADGVVGS